MQGMYLIGVVYCAHGIMTGRVTYGTLTAVMQLIGQVQGPFANISGYLPRWYAMTASAERLMEVEGYDDDMQAADGETMGFIHLIHRIILFISSLRRRKSVQIRIFRRLFWIEPICRII